MQQSFKKPHRHTTIPFLILLLNFSGKKEAKFENAVDVGKYGTHYGPNTVRPGCKVPGFVQLMLTLQSVTFTDRKSILYQQNLTVTRTDKPPLEFGENSALFYDSLHFWMGSGTFRG